MLDISHIPSNQQSTQVFYTTGGTTAGPIWQIWTKPRGARFLQIFCLGSGAGGGGGYAATANTGAGGGGGGASGFSRGFFPAFLIPDTLYISVGIGGAGGAGGTSYVSLIPSNDAKNVLIRSHSSGPGAGNGGTASGGSAGTAAVADNLASFVWSTLGLAVSVGGVTGSAGGLSTSGSNTTALASTILTGGAGDAGITTNTVS